MPLLRYFGFAGGALVLLLFGLSWCVPQPVAEPIRSGIDRPVIRISSVEQLPARVDIDSSLPTIVPPPNVMEFAERWPVANIVEITGTIVENPGPKLTTVSAGVTKKQRLAKREPGKKVAAHRAGGQHARRWLSHGIAVLAHAAPELSSPEVNARPPHTHRE